jgi:Ni,Fe-hydrogenase maturation factor
MTKYHEERGKIKCDCWQCEEKAIIHKEIKKKISKELKEIEKENEEE